MGVRLHMCVEGGWLAWKWMTSSGGGLTGSVGLSLVCRWSDLSVGPSLVCLAWAAGSHQGCCSAGARRVEGGGGRRDRHG
jgi:hypothetical protein